MNKNQFVEFHRLLAILKYELYMNLCETNNEKYIAELQKQLDAIDILMKVLEEFIRKLQLCYFGEKKAFNEIVKYFDTLQSSSQTQCQSLQTKIDEAIDYIKSKLKLKNENGFPYPLFKRAHINHILKILERTENK